MADDKKTDIPNDGKDVLPKDPPPVKCDNHPDRDGILYTGDGAFEVRLCPECTPAWFTQA